MFINTSSQRSFRFTYIYGWTLIALEAINNVSLLKSFPNLIIEFKLFSTNGILEMLYFKKILDNVIKLLF